MGVVGAKLGTAADLPPLDMEPAGSRGVRSLLAVGVLVLFVISWYPFELEVPRTGIGGVETLADGSLRFGDDEFASTTGPPSWLPVAIESERFELSLRVRSSAADQRGPARILALSASPRGAQEDVFAHNLLIGQDGTDLVARIVRPGTNRQGRPDLVVPGVLTPDGWHEIELGLDEHLRLSVDGELRVFEPVTSGWAASWDEGHRLSLGNTLSGTRAWAGTIAHARVVAGEEQVDLLASDELDVDPMGRRLPPRLRVAAARVGVGALLIGVLHVLLGAVIGAAVVLARPARPLVDSLWVVPVLAAVANLGKVLVAARHPSVATFLLQAGGGGLGALATFVSVRGRLAEPPPGSGAATQGAT